MDYIARAKEKLVDFNRRWAEHNPPKTPVELDALSQKRLQDYNRYMGEAKASMRAVNAQLDMELFASLGMTEEDVRTRLKLTPEQMDYLLGRK